MNKDIAVYFETIALERLLLELELPNNFTKCVLAVFYYIPTRNGILIKVNDLFMFCFNFIQGKNMFWTSVKIYCKDFVKQAFVWQMLLVNKIVYIYAFFVVS